MLKIKEIFDYRKKWKYQKNKNKALKKEIKILEKKVTKANFEAEKYFDILIETQKRIEEINGRN